MAEDVLVGPDGARWAPFVRHEEHAGGEAGALWYASEGSFVEEIPGFDATDYFVMRRAATPPPPRSLFRTDSFDLCTRSSTTTWKPTAGENLQTTKHVCTTVPDAF